MLDLKAKLLEAGVVTEKQVKKVEAEEEKKRQKKKFKKKKSPKAPRSSQGKQKQVDEKDLWQRRIRKLAQAGKSEQYEVIRGWVEKHRIDSPKRILSEEAKKFHFVKMDNGISWITIEAEVEASLQKGEYGIIAYMSHNGLSHCVVPRDLAADVHQIRPEWLRKLENYDFTPVIQSAVTPEKTVDKNEEKTPEPLSADQKKTQEKLSEESALDAAEQLPGDQS